MPGILNHILYVYGSFINASNPIPISRIDVLNKLRLTINDNLPQGFSEVMSYGMIGYVVPHSTYPAGYHCNPKLPLPFLSFASQKNFIGFYHIGIYAQPDLLKWFQDELAAHDIGKLDMGKSCIRFKKVEKIPFDLLGELCSKMTPQDWRDTYEAAFKH